MDDIAGGLVCLAARDTSFAAVMHAPIAKIVAFKRRMKWDFAWVSSSPTTSTATFTARVIPRKDQQNMATGRSTFTASCRA
jgi:predicted dithiol-disulfide oxidoreductase (DUF899 family)